MKNLSLFDKFVFIVNSLLAAITLISFSSYYIAPKSIPFISFLSLLIPVFILLNLTFIIYWIIRLKKQVALSILTLLIGFQYVSSFYSLNEKKVLLANDVKVMSYNVRMFNLYNWIDAKNIDENIFDFINAKDPDVLCIQEFHSSKKLGFKFPYKYVKTAKDENHFGQAIFSKYKIIKNGSLDFENTFNNAIFIDVLKGKDTLRVYNVHLETLRIIPKQEEISKENSENLKIRIEKAFTTQEKQIALIVKSQEDLKHKSIICGDFNNTAFSWAYKKLKNGKKDAFEEAGEGFGNTFDFPFPFRIDFILPDEAIQINNFKTYNVKYSDHFPIMARLQF
ncbi:Metal-dependent hydrolase, endonuclease/exonuclease/phosphatase family [Lutibacter agarilyticus]|uniref:Metal-dependent hydrolase, endonuclease/exonuclease/phosphatase family n=1 Tax=Lutibacter agarilyticus TaxID=1109740 RepID=A0A238V8E3_9FLAO|nr:endonuclease/exonuclease/phosphatase family protein [Lutibacter agarilyticus]SNR30307.1 Metal-dependent hydrolase, endonuclease/exonuclease/phosphatase family [Lutibacter agarilyticus]